MSGIASNCKMPAVTVVIPAFNHERYVERCITSVLAQTFTNFEIIVVDDGSQDRTPDILRRYEDRITLIRQDNRGTQAARNTAIRASAGQYIALLDSDDVWLPNKLARQVEAFTSRPGVGLVYGQAHIVDANDVCIGTNLGKPIADPSLQYEQILIENPIPALTAMVRKECFDMVGLFDERLVGAADWDMWLRISARWLVLALPEPLARYRVHDTNTTDHLRKSKLLLTEHLQVLEKAFADPSRRVSELTRNQALARYHLVGAELAACSGDATQAGVETAKALTLDPMLETTTPQHLIGQIVHFAHVYCEGMDSGARYRRFFREFFAALQPCSPGVKRLKNSVVSDATMSRAFASRGQGGPGDIRSLLLMGVMAQPKWLLNRGVRSIAVRAFLGLGERRHP